MDSGRLGGSDLVVTQLGMGCTKLGSVAMRQNRRQALRLVDGALGAGIRLFDTADAYGSGISESILGEALAQAGADVVVATKVGYVFQERSRLHQTARAAASVVRRLRPTAPGVAQSSAYAQQDFSSEYIKRAVIGSLKRLNRERIDLLQFHGPPRSDTSEIPFVVQQLIDDGMIRYFGVGCESLDVAASWVGVEGLASLQLAFGILDPQAATELIPLARRNGVGVIVRGVLGGGVIARFVRGQQTGLDPLRERRLVRLGELARCNDIDVMQLAIWYGMHTVPVDSMLLGISNTTQLTTAVGWATSPLPSDDLMRQIVAIVDDQETG